MHEIHEECEIKRSYQVIRDKNGPKITWSDGLKKEKCVLEVKRFKSVRRDRREQIKNCEMCIYRNLIKAQLIESYRALKRRVLAIKPVIKDLTRGFLNNEARWIEVVIEKLLRRQKVSRWIKLAIESYQEAIKFA